MKMSLIALMALLVAGYVLADIGTDTAARWGPRPTWVSGASPDQFGLTVEAGALVFTIEGVGKSLPWQLTFLPGEGPGEARYLVLTYRAEGFPTDPGDYLLHGWEGTPGGRALILGREVLSDGSSHTVAVDLLSLDALEPLSQIALKVQSGVAGKAKLIVERLWYTDEAPPDAKVIAFEPPARRFVTLDWETLPVEARTGWIVNPATDFGAEVNEGLLHLGLQGKGKAMRWGADLPEPVDVSELNWLSFRYRATGEFGPYNYILWIGDNDQDPSAILVSGRDLIADGRWHTTSFGLQKSFTATQFALGIDSLSEQAELWLDEVTFGSAPVQWPFEKLIEYKPLASPWPAGDGGLTPLPFAASGGLTGGSLAKHLQTQGWFTSERITVDGVPFTLPGSPDQARQTGVAELGQMEVALSETAPEYLVLMAAAAPSAEPWGLDAKSPQPQEVFTEPEKVVFEVRYESGPPDQLMPLQLETNEWGLPRGFSLSAVHPDPARKPVELAVREGMETGTFAILGVTANTGAPKASEPAPLNLNFASPSSQAALLASGWPVPATTEQAIISGPLRAEFSTSQGLTWQGLAIADAPEVLSVAKGPVFEVWLGEEKLPEADWQLLSSEPSANKRQFVLRSQSTGLLAVVEARPGTSGRVELTLSLTNQSDQPLTATVLFPVISGVELGEVADTWYLFGRRGGIINDQPASFREPLGERHPLQLDGFFNPQPGLALGCFTHDTVAQHHFLRMGKDETGGSWAVEYFRRDLAPGATFTATETELAVLEGDWRALFGAYKDWLATWYQPPAAKPWWERTFAFMGINSHYDAISAPRDRGDVQPAIDLMRKYTGYCDYVHMFGPFSSQQYGDWGDYNHYDDTVGGLEYFRANIQRAQAEGIGVGTYQDGYLSCPAGQLAGQYAEAWAMKRADGSLNWVPEYMAFNECPYIEDWREHLASVYTRLQQDFGMKGMYIDEIGATDGRWLCEAKDHGHNGWEIPYKGEVLLAERIREAVGPDISLYSEYPPAEVMRQTLDGSFTYQALWGLDQRALSPHYVDLPRFAFPAFKQFHIIHYVAYKAGNWWPVKFPFFNGESYYLGPGLPGYDPPALALQTRAVQVLCEHRDAFSSSDVEPLVPTLKAGVFANAFRGEAERVWTLYNDTGRTARGPLLAVPHVEGASYTNGWTGEALEPVLENASALLELELAPKAVSCVVQKLP